VDKFFRYVIARFHNGEILRFITVKSANFKFAFFDTSDKYWFDSLRNETLSI